jgi:signal transduction histidine kinase/ActR/RegA family two-component response regulator
VGSAQTSYWQRDPGRSAQQSVTEATPNTQTMASLPLSRAPRVLPLQEHLELDASEAPKWLGVCMAGVFLGYAIYDLIWSRGAPRQSLLWLDASTSALVTVLTLTLFHRRLQPHWGQPVLAAFALMSALNIAISAAIRQSLIDVAYVPFMLVAAGAFVQSAVWLAVIGTIILVLAVPAALHVLPSAHVVEYLMSLLGALALTLTVFLKQRRANRQVLRLRGTDRRLADSLREALEVCELRLREQQQTGQRRQELEDQLRQSQKLEAVGVLAGGVAHDMNNVLGAITSIASLASSRIKDDPVLKQDVDDILSAARRGSALTRNLLGFARRGSHLKERYRIDATIESIARLLRCTISKQIELKVETPADLDDVIGDPGQLSHVLMNLCINAVDATEGRGTITIRTRNLWVDSEHALLYDIPVGRYVELAVEDDGCGIPPDVLPRVFEPFFSTKSSNERSGLGLSMVYGTVRDHGGAVVIESTVGCGTKIRALVPSRLMSPASVVPPEVHPVLPTDARRVILLVDDEPLLRSAGRRIIQSLGFEVLLAANGAEAVAIFRRQSDRIALVVLDVAMPVMDGSDCFRRLREIDSNVAVLVASGYAKHGDVDDLLVAGATGYLSKPYDCAQMSSAIHRCLSLSQTIAIGAIAGNGDAEHDKSA